MDGKSCVFLHLLWQSLFHSGIHAFTQPKSSTQMTENIILISLSVLPVLLLAGFVYRKDKYQKEPIRMLFKAFFFGILSVIPAIFLEHFLSSRYTAFASLLPSWFGGIYDGFVVAGFSEELCKLLLLTLAVWRSRYFDEYFDGIVYSTFVGLGFAGIENIMYVFNQESFFASILTGSMRAILSVPAHFLFATVMGYYFARAKFEPENRFVCFLQALFLPLFLHGTFDALLMIPEAAGEGGGWISVILFPVFIYFDIKLWKVGMMRLSHLQQLSQDQFFGQGGSTSSGDSDDFQQDDTSQPSDPFSGFTWKV